MSLTSKQYAAITALLTERTVEDAAKKAKCTGRSIFNWQKQQEFQTEFRAARRAMVDQAVVVLQQLTREAVDALRRNLTDPASPGVQVQAAKEILDKAMNAQSMLEMQAEIQELRARLEYGNAGNAPTGTGQDQGGSAEQGEGEDE